jgi:hypothetical protein
MKIFICSLFAILLIGNTSAQTTWDGGGGNTLWTMPNNWNPNGVPGAAADLLFNNGGTITITQIPISTTIGKIRVTNNTTVILIGNTAGNTTLTVSAAAADAIDVDAGSTLQIRGIRQGADGYSLTLTTTNTIGLQANIDGTLIVTREAINRPGTRGIFTKGGANATINFNGGSVYRHNVDGSLIPLSTWNANSTCNITGLTNAAPSGLNQNFGHFTYDCPDHATLINFNSALTSIAGNFTVRYAGEEQGTRTLNGLALSSNTSFTINIGGNLIVDHYTTEATWLMMTTGTANVIMNVGGDFLMSNTGGSGSCFFDFKQGTTTAMGTLIMNVAGNLTMTGGYLDMGYQASSYTVGTELRLNGNLSVSATSTIITSGSNIINGTIIFNRAGNQTMFESAAGVTAYVNYRVNNGSTTELLSNFYLYDYITAIKSGNFNVQNGGILDMNTFTLHGYSVAGISINILNTYTSFILNSGAGIITANPNGVHLTGFINGSISAAIATRTFNSGANYTYDGTVNQNSGTFITTPIANTVNNLTINNSTGVATTGVTLQQNFNVNGTLNLQLGHFTTFLDRLITLNASSTLIGGTDNSFVNGPMRKVGNTAFTFPVGKLIVPNSYNPSGFAGGWRPIGIFNATGSSVTDSYTAEYFISNANLIGPITSPGLLKVNPCEYWGLKRDAANTNTDVSVTLHWKPKSDCNPGAYIVNPIGVTAVLNSTGVPLVNGSGPWDNHNGIGMGTPTDGSVTFPFVSSALMSSFTGAPYGEFTPFAIGSVNRNEAPLPFELKEFNAKPKDQSVILDWLVNKNELVKKFTIERSKDGYHFESLKTVKAVVGVQSASYNDKDLLPFSGWSFYRLRITNQDDIDVFSSVQKVWVGKSGSWLQVSPKPAKEKLLVNLAAPERITELSIINSMGQVMFKLTRLQSMNQLDISRLKPGIYYIRVIGVDGSFTDNFIKQ